MVQGFESVLALLIAVARRVGARGVPVLAGYDHADAVYGTGRHAQVATGTVVGQYGMHQFVGTHNGVDRAGLYAQRATYTVGFVDDGNPVRERFAAVGIQRPFGSLQQGGQGMYAVLATRRATIDVFAIQCDGVRIRATTVVAAFRALGLREHRINAVDEQGR